MQVIEGKGGWTELHAKRLSRDGISTVFHVTEPRLDSSPYYASIFHGSRRHLISCAKHKLTRVPRSRLRLLGPWWCAWWCGDEAGCDAGDRAE